MAEDIIGIEVQGEIHAIKDESASTKTDVDNVKYRGIRTPLFMLEEMEAKEIAPIPTASSPVTVIGNGALTPTTSNVKQFKISLSFFNDCMEVTRTRVIANGAVPSEWTTFGYVEFRIHTPSIKTLLKNKYTGREDEIDNYVDNVFATFINAINRNDNETIVTHGEPGATCITTQKLMKGNSSNDYFGIRYTNGYVIKVIEEGEYHDNTITYNTSLIIKERPS